MIQLSKAMRDEIEEVVLKQVRAIIDKNGEYQPKYFFPWVALYSVVLEDFSNTYVYRRVR